MVEIFIVIGDNDDIGLSGGGRVYGILFFEVLDLFLNKIAEFINSNVMFVFGGRNVLNRRKNTSL